VMTEAGVELEDRHIDFANNYVLTWSAMKAAKAAGYSEKTAKEIGHQIINYPNVRKYIEWIKSKAAESVNVSFMRNLQELAKIAYSNAADLRIDWDKTKEWADLDDDQKGAIAEIHVYHGKKHQSRLMKYKLHDKMKAIDLLNKMLGYNSPDKVDLSGSVNIPPIEWVD
jgi:phage terminase small subunit